MEMVQHGRLSARLNRLESLTYRYSALGIDRTTVRYGDPIGRGYEYVPGTSDGQYEPISEVFGSGRKSRRVV